jgi:hypothetical protein
VKLFPITLISGAALIADRKAAGIIAAITFCIERCTIGRDASRDFDSLTSMGAKLSYETNGNVIVHKNTSFQGDYTT